MPIKSGDLLPEKQILKIIILVRGEKVILDSDLATLYGVETRHLNEQARRNVDKFPDDFMFQLTKDEFENLKSQFATSSSTWGGLFFIGHVELNVAQNQVRIGFPAGEQFVRLHTI